MGTVDFQEMSTFCNLLAKGTEDEKFRFLFKACDVSDSGEIDMENDTVSQLYANRVAHEVFVQADRDKSGTINFKEFMFWAKRGGRTVDQFFELFPIFSVFLK